MHKNIGLVLTLGMLCSSLSPVYSRVDAIVEEEIKRDYHAFTGRHIEGLKQQPCRAIQFVYYLQEQLHREQKHHKNTKHTADKITAVISEGAGVGGIDTSRQSTEDERKIAYGALYEVIDEKADIPSLTLEASSNPTLIEHQKVVQSIYLTKHNQDLKLKSFNFLKDDQSYNTLANNLFKYLKSQEFEKNNSSSSSFKTIEVPITDKEGNGNTKPELNRVKSESPEYQNITYNINKWRELYKESEFLEEIKILRSYITEQYLRQINSLNVLLDFTLNYPTQILDENVKRSFLNGVKRLKLINRTCLVLQRLNKLPEKTEEIINECNKNWKKFNDLEERLEILPNDLYKKSFEDWFKELSRTFKLTDFEIDQILNEPNFRKFEDDTFRVFHGEVEIKKTSQISENYLTFTFSLKFCQFRDSNLSSALKDFYEDIFRNFSDNFRKRILSKLEKVVEELKAAILFKPEEFKTIKDIESGFSYQFQQIVKMKDDLKSFENILEQEDAPQTMRILIRDLFQQQNLPWQVSLFEYLDNLINAIEVFKNKELIELLEIEVEDNNLKAWLKSQRLSVQESRKLTLWEMLNYKNPNTSTSDFNNYFVKQLNDITLIYNNFIKHNAKVFLEQQLIKDINYFDYVLEFYKIGMSLKKDHSNSNLKKAFRQISLNIHPDKNSNLNASEIFKELQKIFARIELFNNLYC